VQLSLKAAAHGASAKRFAGEDDYGEQLRVNYFAFLWLQNVMSFFFKSDGGHVFSCWFFISLALIIGWRMSF
jgi:hypothetical protein